MLNLYIHIPICQQKCPYCHFFSLNQKSINIEKYLLNLKKEFTHKLQILKLENKKITTIYFGGGTPSLLSSKQLNSLINFIKNNSNIDKNLEITIEVNPMSINKEYLTKLKNTDVNRLSFGIQSINTKLFQFHQRSNNVKHLKNLFNTAKDLNFTFNLDFIYGWPKQNLADVKKDLDFALAIKPDHLSFYELEIKKHTPIYKLYKSQHKIFPKEITLIKMRQLIEKTLKKPKWEHHEISNWCKNKKYSQHNLNFWKGEEYLGIGLNAHSFIDNKMIINNTNLKNYYNHKKSFTITPLTNAEYTLQYIMKTLRSNQGIILNNLKITDKSIIYKTLRSIPEKYFNTKNSKRIILSEQGWLKYNYLLSKISEAIYENHS